MDEKIIDAINNLKKITEIASRAEKILNEIIQNEFEAENNAEKSWDKITKILKEQMGQIKYNTYIKGLKAKKIEDNVLILIAPNTYIKNLVEIKYLEDMKKIGREILKETLEIKIELEKN